MVQCMGGQSSLENVGVFILTCYEFQHRIHKYIASCRAERNISLGKYTNLRGEKKERNEEKFPSRGSLFQ